MRKKKFSYVYIGREIKLFKEARKDWGRKLHEERNQKGEYQ